VIDAVGAETLGLQYDSFHAALITGDALACWRAHAARVTHIQISSPPDRTEPGGGGVDWPALYAAIRDSGYDGYVSAEYHPATESRAGLRWLAGARAALAS
jgi:hydroxypyruvate isomerase